MLAGLYVVDCTGRLGWLTGRLLADMGANVVKVEAPGADLCSPEWQALNINKRLLRLDLESRAAAKALDSLVSTADFLIATPQAGTDDDGLFDIDRLHSINPRLIVVAITPFGLTGPKSQWRASDLEIMAAAGAMSLAGEPGGEPMRVSAPQSSAWAGAQAAVGATMALAARARIGRGQLVDVSAQAAVITALAHAPAFVDIAGTTPTRAGAFITGRSVAGAKYRVFWPCVDGHINFILYGGAAGRRTNEHLVAWMREEGVDAGPLAAVDWSSFDPTQANQAQVDAMEAPIARFLARMRKREFLEGAHRREMLGYPVSSVQDISTDPQLQARAFWQDVKTAGERMQRHCGAFYIRDGQRPALKVPTPAQVAPAPPETEREPASA
jgi:crotonobetainyl-CoA:carnitine CoA-transferase CaiB-like acyl-CoA transferase